MNENQNLHQPPEFSPEELKMPDEVLAHPESAHHGRLAIILVLLIIALVLILGGLYLWYLNAFQTVSEPFVPTEPAREVPAMPNEPEMQNADATIQQLETVSTSNEISVLEADIESTNLDSIDAELNAIDAELNAALNTQ